MQERGCGLQRQALTIRIHIQYVTTHLLNITQHNSGIDDHNFALFETHDCAYPVEMKEIY